MRERKNFFKKKWERERDKGRKKIWEREKEREWQGE
jgi:hypothetical protein